MIWRLIARCLVRSPHAVDYLIRRAQRTPYTNIPARDGSDTYMGRWWLFNAYGKDESGNPTPARWPRLPNIRIHHIQCEDIDRHLHDHPWLASTIVLRGWYEEERSAGEVWDESSHSITVCDGELRERFLRRAGYTGRLEIGARHRITQVSAGGVWTLFITGRKCNDWGFWVNGNKVPWREYLGINTGAKG